MSQALAKDWGCQDVVPAMDHEHGKASLPQLLNLSIRDAVRPHRRQLSLHQAAS